MHKKILALFAMACLATVPFSTAQTQNSSAGGFGAATAGIMSPAASTPIPTAVSTASTTSGMEKNPQGVTKLPMGQTGRCTYAYSQAYGACPASKMQSSCSYASSQANAVCR